MSVLIGGGTGFIGRHLSNILVENGYKVTAVSRKSAPDHITWNEISRNGLPDGCTAVVNLAGENILNPFKRWNNAFKEEVVKSRVETTKLLASAIKSASTPPEVFVTMSGVGYYQPNPFKEYTEDSPGGDHDFLSRLSRKWEEVGNLPESLKVRRVIVRSGVVLGRDGGMIQQIFLPFFLGVGGRIGSGRQFFPWIHVGDMASIITFAIMNENVTGVLNGVAPEVATNNDFTKAFGAALYRPTLIPTPGWAMEKVFGEERGKIILSGQKVIPKRTLELGYEYLYPDLKSACKEFARLSLF